MSRYRNELAGQREALKALWAGLLVATGLAVFMGIGWATAPKSLLVHIPPDLSGGAVVAPGMPGAPNVYTFALYIWQQLYRWPVDGAGDYAAKAEMLAAYLTPRCRQDRLDDAAARRNRRELQGRRRAVWEIPGRGYEAGRVVVEGSGSWVVWLDLQIEETILGEPVKARAASYPIRVVRYDVDRELNPFGLAVDCLAAGPRAIGIEGEGA